MVKICPKTYPKNLDEKYNHLFSKYSFSLSPFQKYAIEAIYTGNNVLVTAHTGSGKTLPAEFAIEYFTFNKKKVIYTAPIKALSNQKFYEFSRKYKNISFGILTGDIKTNPEADVLIMTTEILLNSLYNDKSEFDMNYNDLGCVIFDEVHYINDPERGRVWEEAIMMLPSNVQMVMLSATIDTPENFAKWIETNKPEKIVYLASTNERVVPLTHYGFITVTNGIYKAIKNKELEAEIKSFIN